MTSASSRYVVLLASALAACQPPAKSTILPVPNGALDVRQIDLLEGRAHQTDFTLRVKFPASLALEHYSRVVPEPWIRCDWSGPEWQSFLDGTANPIHTVHQQLHMWVNRPAHRTLLLSTKYYSQGTRAPTPTNDDQRVVVVEYFNDDIDETISRLKLTCPAKQVRSNSAAHPDAREPSHLVAPSESRAGGRER